MVSIRRLRECDNICVAEILSNNEFSICYNCLEELEDVIFQNLNNGFYHDAFVILDSNEIVIAFIYSYDYRPIDMLTKFNVKYVSGVVDDDLIIGIRIFTEYIFREYPIRKIIFEDINYKIKNSLIKIGFSTEAVLKEYYYYGGTYRDCIILSKERTVE